MLGSDERYFGRALTPSWEHRLGCIRMKVTSGSVTECLSGASGVGAEA